MQEFIQLATQQLGIGQSQAETATGGLLNLIRQSASESDASAIFNAVPGAEALASSAGGAAGAGGGLLGAVGGLLGGSSGNLGGVVQIISALKEAGIDAGQFAELSTLFFDFLKGSVGQDIISKVAAALPSLGGLFADAA